MAEPWDPIPYAGESEQVQWICPHCGTLIRRRGNQTLCYTHGAVKAVWRDSREETTDEPD
jgi:rubrerythrin